MVEVDKDYEFDGPDGKVRLLDMFEGRRQLIIYHFMFDPEWDDGCPSCTAGTDELSAGFLDHLHTRDTTYAMVSRRRWRSSSAGRPKQGWDMPWYSSFGSDFNYDFGVTIDESVDAGRRTTTGPRPSSRPMGEPTSSTTTAVRDARAAAASSRSTAGCSTPTRSTPAGLESTGGSYYFLDLTALGRQEDWEEPKGRTESARGNRPDFAS